MNISMIETKKLIPYDNNPRNNDDAVDAVACSIQEFGFKQPIVADENMVIIAGHTRYKAAQLLKMDKVPVLTASDLSPDQVRAYRLADNKTAELAEWDYNALGLELAEIDDIDMADFGFDIPDIEMDGFGTDFELPDGGQPEIRTMSFTLHEKQQELIKYAMDVVKDNIQETFGNGNANGNALHEVVRQWAELRERV